ncbi:MAG: zf-HC2 domain-containing protein [Candidatus Polarisedimenticolia bacterium]
MPGHDEYQEEIAAHAAGRLDEGARKNLEAHLAACQECADVATTWQAVAAGIRQSDDSLFGPHPAPSCLRRHAAGVRVEESASVVRHLESCPACALEVSVWRAGGARVGSGSSTASTGAPATGIRRRPWRSVGGALAAGVLIGLAIPALLHRAARDTVTPAPPSPASGWGGPVQLLVLNEPLRGEADVPEHRVSTSAPWIVIATRPAVPVNAAPDDLFRFEIVGAGSRVVWDVDVRTDWIEQQLRSAEVVTLAVAATDLPPCRYRLRVRPSSGAAEPLLSQVPFEILP